MRKLINLLFLVCVVSLRVSAQSNLDNYIRLGLDSNQSIRQQQFELQKSIYALGEAKTLFYPDISFNADYTLAKGGRAIDLPLGDLMNPVYATLNQLTNSSNFRPIQNQHVLLNPNNYYDARFRTTLPLINAELVYNKRIKQNQVYLQQTQTALYKRELVRDIKNAYYQVASSAKAIEIYRSSLKLVEENRRINTALFNNQKINHTAVIRSENEVTKINARLLSARESFKSARAYFNFLVNRPLTDSVVIDAIKDLPVNALLADTSVLKREEIESIRIAGKINDNVTGVNKAYIIPKLGSFIDLGSQATDWKVNSASRYYFFGLSLQWNLFASGKNNFKIKQSTAEKYSLNAEKDYIQKQLETQLNMAKNAYQAASAQYDAAQAELKTAGRYYNDELKLYKQGQALYIELLDAQHQLIDAQLEANIALYDAWSKCADIERANASFNLN